MSGVSSDGGSVTRMSHDPLCRNTFIAQETECVECLFIAKVRNSERREADSQWNSASYLAERLTYENAVVEVRRQCSQEIRDYADEFHQHDTGVNQCSRCDATAALVIASKKLLPEIDR